MSDQMIFMALGLGYLLGSVPFGLVLTKFAGMGDIRAIGSGNIGATNVLRTGNKPLAALTLLLDGGKGAAAALIAMQIDPQLAPLAGAGAFIGHLYPVWLKFKGGKGVATFMGVLLALNWMVGLAAIGTWLAAHALFRMSSFAAPVASALAPLWSYLMAEQEMVLLSFALMAAIYMRHWDNIQRILKGEEPKIGKQKDAK